MFKLITTNFSCFAGRSLTIAGNRFVPALLLCGALTALLFTACNQGADPDQPDTPDVSDVKVSALIRRLDRDLFGIDTTRFLESFNQLAAKYPVALPFFASEIAYVPESKMTPETAVYDFITAPQVRKLNDSCQVAFPDLEQFQNEVTSLMQFYKYYFPQKKELVTITAVTEFVGDAFMVDDTTMMIGLDFYLGENFLGYNPSLFPQYLRRQFTKENMIVKYGFALSNYLVAPPKTEQILDHMIRNGKVLYIMDCLLPAVPDSVKLNYSKADLEGAIFNEQETWARLLDMKVLYEPLSPRNMKIVTAGPSTDNVFRESPGQIGNWIGWQIVKSYIKRNPDITLKDLAQQDDAQAFLEKAKYKPKKK